MTDPVLGFVGFGEAGFHIAKWLTTAGIAGVCAFDINRDTPELGETIRRRAKEAQIRLVDSSKELAASAGIFFSSGERRAREMEEVAETLRSLGIEPIMSQAAARRQGLVREVRNYA